MCVPYGAEAHESQKRVLDPQDLKLHLIVSLHVGS